MVPHHPVLLQDVVGLMAPAPGRRYLDGTLGDGGHALALLEASAPDGLLMGLDRDPEALQRAGRTLEGCQERCALRCLPASAMGRALDEAGWPPVDGVLLDLGLSSPQLDSPERGFSILHDGPLDMRFDRRQDTSAGELVNEASEDELARIVRQYGEEPSARRVARAIVQGRPFQGTHQLAAAVELALGGRRGRRIHPATRTFQALRIAVNSELDELRGAVQAALDAVAPDGRVLVIAFHSLEDRIVKRMFAEVTGRGTPRDAFGNPIPAPSFRSLTRRPVKGEQQDSHPRARSARLRAVQRLSPEAGYDQTSSSTEPSQQAASSR